MTLEERAAALSPAEIVALLRQNETLARQAAELQRQVEWCKRQLFGQKSERRLREPDAQQLPLAGLLLDKFRYHRVTRRQLPQAMGRRKSCCIEDEGRPLGIGLWDQVPNPVKLLCLRGRGVSVDAHVRPRPGR